MRYAIISKDLTISQLQLEVNKCGGKNLKIASASKQIFCDLSEAGVTKLRAIGYIVSKVGGVRADVTPPIITPPIPVAAAPVYTPEELLWAVAFEDFRSLTEPPLYGEGVNLAIIDSGIRESHQKIYGRVIYRKNYTTDPMRDGLDHGTGVCSIALAVAPLCNILNLKVLDDKGEGTEEDVALAIDDCIALHDTNPAIAPSVINLSLGAPDDGNPFNPLRVVCRAAIDKGIWIAASCGNNGPASFSVTCPACEQYVFAIGSAKFIPEESSFILSGFSSRGPTLEGLIKPDLIMFGEDISVASSVGDSSTIAKTGTSFATPFCSGMGVEYIEGMLRGAIITTQIPGVYPEITELVSMEDMMDVYLPGICIKPEGIPLGKDSNYGHGLPFGPLMVQAITYRPLIDISTIMIPIMSIVVLSMVGAMIVPMVKVEK